MAASNSPWSGPHAAAATLTPSRPAPPVPPARAAADTHPPSSDRSPYSSSPAPHLAFDYNRLSPAGPQVSSPHTIVRRGWVSAKEDGLRAWLWSKKWLVLREQSLALYKNEVRLRSFLLPPPLPGPVSHPQDGELISVPATRRALRPLRRPSSSSQTSRPSRARTSSRSASPSRPPPARTTSRSSRTRSCTPGWTTSTPAHPSSASRARPTSSTRSTSGSTPSRARSPASPSSGLGSSRAAPSPRRTTPRTRKPSSTSSSSTRTSRSASATSTASARRAWA